MFSCPSAATPARFRGKGGGKHAANVFHLIYRYLQQNMDWFEEELGEYENDYLIIDCPGMPKLPTLALRDIQFAMHHTR